MKMLLKFVILVCVFVVSFQTCLGAATPAAKPQQGATPLPSPAPAAVSDSRVYCDETPAKIFACLDNPNVVNKDVIKKCKMGLSECDQIKCIFRASGWSTNSSVADDKVNKQKVAEYFNEFAIDNPVWSAAVQHLKSTCLDKDLPAQGVTQNCAAYDIMHCIQTSFLRNASPFQWKNTTECVYPRTYASACPICPASCYAKQIPIGTCNACLALAKRP